MIPRLFAFDLDGTLLTSQKTISTANAKALREMADSGAVVTLASGRLGSSMRQFAPGLDMELAMLTLNGAAVYMGSGHGNRRVYDASLSPEYADFLIQYWKKMPCAINYYFNDHLYSVRNETTGKWIDLYHQQTRSHYNYLASMDEMRGSSPSKIIFVGDEKFLDEQGVVFREKWRNEVYICRTWEYYLEFLSPLANKGRGLEALADAYGIDMSEVAAFGDANNDIPMLEKAGLGVAMFNAPDPVKKAASRVSPWTNDEDGVAREWELLKKSVRI